MMYITPAYWQETFKLEEDDSHPDHDVLGSWMFHRITREDVVSYLDSQRHEGNFLRPGSAQCFKQHARSAKSLDHSCKTHPVTHHNNCYTNLMMITFECLAMLLNSGWSQVKKVWDLKN